MGTVFEIVAYGESQTQVSDAIDQALQEVVRLDDVMSDYKPDSALEPFEPFLALPPAASSS